LTLIAVTNTPAERVVEADGPACVRCSPVADVR
jgi:hypothetical protein